MHRDQLCLYFFSVLLPAALFINQTFAQKNSVKNAFDIPKAETLPVLDGQPNDQAWQQAHWRPINQTIIGEKPKEEDFSGRYKLIWAEHYLFMLVEITDDVLLDKHTDPLFHYWEDDTLEILIDENASGGDHLNNFNAFAYHISLDNQIVDILENGSPGLLNDHLTSTWKRQQDGKVIWELAIKVYTDAFNSQASASQNQSALATLQAEKTIGIMVAYCDADDLNGRQNFMTSYDIKAVDGSKNRAYIDASVFEQARLIE